MFVDKKLMVSHFFSLQSEALQKLSFAPRKVVATGGGAVVRPVNWYSRAIDINLFPLSHILYNLYILYLCQLY